MYLKVKFMETLHLGLDKISYMHEILLILILFSNKKIREFGSALLLKISNSILK